MKTNLSIQRSLFLMVIFITSLQATSQVDQRIAMADKYYEAGDYFTAAGLYEQFLNPPKKEIPKASFPCILCFHCIKLSIEYKKIWTGWWRQHK